MIRLASVAGTARRVAAEFSEKNVTFMAAGIAYNAFVSLAPTLLILFLIVSAVGGGIEARVVEASQQSLPGPIADVVAEIFQGEAATPGASVVGLVVLVWGSLKIFRGLDTAFSEIYETAGENSLVDRFVDGAVVLTAIVVATLATVVVTAAFAALEGVVPYIGLLTPLVLIAGLVLAFFPVYWRFPDVDLAPRHVLPGVVLAAAGWALLQALFQVYLAFANPSAGSFFGGVVVVVTWLYFSGLVLLLGAVVNAVLGGYASGEAGGVGRGAGDFEPRREETVQLAAFVEYLEDLRAEVAGTADPAGATRPRPAGAVHVEEGIEATDDGREWSIAIRWPYDGEDVADAEAGSRRRGEAEAGSAQGRDDVPAGG